MFELVLPYLIALGLEMEMPGDGAGVASAQASATEAAPATSSAAARTPEDQTPTGKFMTATEIKPIMDVTRGQWVAVRLYEGQDWVYFTQMMSWRCGFWEVRYGINGAAADQIMPMEPCYDDTASPNAFVDNDLLPLLTFPPETVQSLTVEVLYDDGTTDSATYERSAVLIP